MSTGSKIQASLGQTPEVFWAVYVEGTLKRGYIAKRVNACLLAQSLRNEGYMKVKVVRM